MAFPIIAHAASQGLRTLPILEAANRLQATGLSPVLGNSAYRDLLKNIGASMAKFDTVAGVYVGRLFGDGKALGETLNKWASVGANIGMGLTALNNQVSALGINWGDTFTKWGRWPDDMHAALQCMGEHGWYLDHMMGFAEAQRFQRRVLADDLAAAEAETVQHFEERLDAIEAELAEQFPARQHIFEAAFRAHRNGDYVLSIPALLTQVDGICFDVAKSSLFMERERQALGKFVTSQVNPSTATTFFGPFISTMPIWLSKDDRKKSGFSGLNRHLVLHGESVDHGTYQNSLRAVSLLTYVAQSLALAQEGDDSAHLQEAEPSA